MIKYVKGDIFNSPSKILVNAVNTVGVMGKGVALEFKNQYPQMYTKYKYLCEQRQLNIGDLYLWRSSEKWILLFPTKAHWRNPSKLEYIEEGLKRFANNWDKMGTDSIAFPRLGCGNGGLDWNIVCPLMERYLSNIPMDILVYVDDYIDPLPEHKNISEIEKWLLGEHELYGFELFMAKLNNYIDNNVEIAISEDATYKLSKADNSIMIGQLMLNESQICDMWNCVRDARIIKPENLPFEYNDIALVFLELMRKLGYVANVFVSNDGIEFTNKPNAYQYISD